MKSVNIILSVALWVIVVGMAFWLYKVIQDPVAFEEAKEIRIEATKNRLKDIKVAQEYYKQTNQTFANNFDDLISTIKTEELKIIKTNGDPDDTTIVTTYDTIYIPILDEIKEKRKFKGTEDIEQLRYIPLTENLEFSLAMDTLTQQRVKLSVFEAKATKQKYLSGLDEERILNPAIEDLSIGSLESASGKGSWE